MWRVLRGSCIHQMKGGHYEKETEDELLEIENVDDDMKQFKRRLKNKAEEFSIQQKKDEEINVQDKAE